MRFRKITLILVAVAMAATLALAAEVTAPGTKISIQLPREWTVDTPQGGVLIKISSTPIQGFKSTISLSKEDLAGKSPQAWLAEYKSGLAKHIGEYKLIKAKEMKLSNTPYTVLDFRGNMGKAPMHWLQAIHFQEGYAWIFSGVTREKLSPSYMKIFKKAFSSIYFPPPPPENFVANALSEIEVALMWTPHTLATGGYEIQRRDADLGAWETVAKLPAGSSTYSDNTSNCGTEVRYRIRCLNPKGDSNWSKEVSAVLQMCPVLTPEEPIVDDDETPGEDK